MPYNYSPMTVIGNLTRDPELRTTSDGTSMTFLNVAVNEGQGDNETTIFVDAAAYGSLAENFAESTVKGSRVILVLSARNRKIVTVRNDEEVDSTIMAFSVIHGGPELRFSSAELTKNPKKSRQDEDAIADAEAAVTRRARKVATDDEDEAPKGRSRRTTRDEAEEKPARRTTRTRTVSDDADDDVAPTRRTRRAPAADDDEF